MAVVIPQQSYTRGYYPAPVRQSFSQPYTQPIHGHPTYVPQQIVASPYHSVVNQSASVQYVPQQVYQHQIPQQIPQQIVQREKTAPVAPSDLPVPALGPNMTEVTYRIVGSDVPITEPVISEITYRLLGADGVPLNGGGETSRDIDPSGDVELAKPLLPGQHLPTADGFTSPYETLTQSLNRNPFFRSFYDVPAALRNAEQPPPDFVIHQEDPNAHLLGGPPGQEPYYEAAYGQPVEFQRGRLRLLAQREEQLKDHGPAVHLSEFTLYDPYGIPIDMRDAIASCPSLGYSPDGEEPQRAIDMSGLGLKFSRREIPHFPVDLEIDLGRRVAVGSYSWTTAMDTPGRDPVSWSFQILTSHGWVTLDQVTDYDVTKARSAVVGPFRLDVAGDPTVLNPPPPPPQQRAIEGPLDYNSVATERLFELLNTGGSDHITERVEELLRKLANPNAVDSYGRTPLLKACVRGDSAVIRLLLDYNADPNAQARTGESGLHRLALSTDDIHCMEALLQAGADPNVFDGQGDTPLMISAARADPASVQLLLRSGARADLRNTRYQTALDMLEEEVRRQGPNVSVQNASEVRRLLSASGPQLF